MSDHSITSLIEKLEGAEVSSITPHVPHLLRFCWICREPHPKAKTSEKRHPSGLGIFICQAIGCEIASPWPKLSEARV